MAEGAAQHICKVTGMPFDTVHFHFYRCNNCRKATLVKWKSYKGNDVAGSGQYQ